MFLSRLGDEAFGIKSLSPLKIKEAVVTTDNFVLKVTDGYSDDMKNVKITEAL